VKRNDLARLGIHGDPDPLLVGLLLHEAPHLIRFRFQAGHQDFCRLGGELGMEMSGTGCKAFHQKVQEPRETHAYCPADPAERDTLA
jgi:hypothetical protein